MSVCVFGGIAASLVLLYSLALPKDAFSRTINRFVGKNILWIGFFISLAAALSSLVYSNFIGYPPCMLCWYARIAFYPQVVLFALALLKRDRNIIDYALALTVMGLFVTGYHSIIQMVGYSPLPCEIGGISCVTRDVFEYGFITIPFMGFVGFAMQFLCLLSAKQAHK